MLENETLWKGLGMFGAVALVTCLAFIGWCEVIQNDDLPGDVRV